MTAALKVETIKTESGLMCKSGNEKQKTESATHAPVLLPRAS
jgi:hypothetical protein